jgi:hypothetical protein
VLCSTNVHWLKQKPPWVSNIRSGYAERGSNLLATIRHEAEPAESQGSLGCQLLSRHKAEKSQGKKT